MPILTTTSKNRIKKRSGEANRASEENVITRGTVD